MMFAQPIVEIVERFEFSDIGGTDFDPHAFFRSIPEKFVESLDDESPYHSLTHQKRRKLALSPRFVDEDVAFTSCIRITCMEGEYSQEWAELRRLRRQTFRVAAVGAGIFVAILLVTTFASRSAAKIIGFVLFAGWVLVLLRFFFVSGEYAYWSCPRCGKPFHHVAHWFGRLNNPFAQCCVHCGLPKWVDSDPDPKLKHELDPFRSDSMLKLGH